MCASMLKPIMPPFDDAAEKAILLAAKVKRRYWERWAEDNKEAIAAYYARIAKEGLSLAKYRTFARSLGDGLFDSN